MTCQFCGHQTPEGDPFCDLICEENAALTDEEIAEIDQADPDLPDPYQDEPDAQTLALLIS